MRKLTVAAAAVLAAVTAVLAATGVAGARPAAPRKTLTIGISHYAQVIPFYSAMEAGFAAGARRYGMKVITTDSEFDPGKQVANIESLISRHVDAIVASPGDANALIPAYKEAAAAHIPIISIANHLAPAGKKYETSFYGRPWDEVSAVRTKALAKYMHGTGQLAVIRGPSPVAFVQDDRAGLERVLKGYPGIKIVFAQNSKDLSIAEGLRLAQDALTAHPQIGGLWVEEDDLAAGAARVLQQRGLAGKIPVVTMDGDPKVFQLIKQGVVTLDMALPTYSWGIDQMRILHDHFVKHRAIPKYVPSKVVVATKANIAALIGQCKKTPAELWCGK